MTRPRAAHQVAALDELDAHRAGQQRVLEVGRVVDARREHDDGRVADAGRRGLAQRGEQRLGVLRHRADAVVGEHLGQRGRQRAAVGHDVRDAGRHPDVVLQHPEVAVAVADEVDAGDVDAYAVGRLQAGDDAVEVRRRHDHRARHHAVGEQLAGSVDVGEEGLERAHPLPDAAVDVVPLLGLDQPRHDVERERALLALDAERDALVEVGRGERVGPLPDLVVAHLLEGRVDVRVVLADVVPSSEHLVEPGHRSVALEEMRVTHTPTLGKDRSTASRGRPFASSGWSDPRFRHILGRFRGR